MSSDRLEIFLRESARQNEQPLKDRLKKEAGRQRLNTHNKEHMTHRIVELQNRVDVLEDERRDIRDSLVRYRRWLCSGDETKTCEEVASLDLVLERFFRGWLSASYGIAGEE